MKIAGVFYAAAVVLAFQGLNISAASAQTQSSVVSGCTRGGSCASLVTGYLNSLRASGASAAAINEAAVNLTVELAGAAQTTAVARRQIVAGIQAAAAGTTNVAQRTQMLSIAQTILVGDEIPQTAASDA